eukprot:CAMPEP_0116904398 /NCGR_PEP_ID=MMETSP0467-20121206/11404_1 /TAXON_ID=283647 /ORGANISM="Mesodinium pulex, Strain SPMC105" /LENGTH=140 /DNA_ID=CAMNT_0004579053 /DNA_START=913 /DNA_END=1335 /DNA_ORIENTATION=+
MTTIGLYQDYNRTSHDSSGMLDQANEEEANKTEALDNLCFYEFAHLSFTDAVRTCLNVFNLDLAFENLYSAEVDRDAVEGSQTVWHNIKFVNESAYAFTSGPVMITTEQNAFICQDLLKFCAASEEGRIRLTRAMDIRVN